MLNKYRAGVVPAASNTLEAAATAATAKARECYLDNDPQGALIAAWELVDRANLFVEETKPFHLAKDPAQAALLDSVLYNLVESCRILAVLVHPVMPGTAGKIFAQLKTCGEPSEWRQSTWGGLGEGHQVGAPIPLFPRKDLAPKPGAK